MTRQFRRSGHESSSEAQERPLDDGMPAPPDQQHRSVQSSHKGTAFDLEVRRCDTHPGSYILIVIRGAPGYLQQRMVEYVTDDSTVDSAVHSGLEIARAYIDGQLD